MFVRTLQPLGKSLSRSTPRQRRAKALPDAGHRPQIEWLEDRTLLSAASQALVAQMYQDLLQRPADAGGLANWSAALDHGASPAQIARDLAQSPEARALQVQSLYQQFLHRAADPAGLNGFTKVLAAGLTLEQVATAIVSSPEYYQNRGGGSDSGFLAALYQDALNRQIDASGAASFGQALAGGTARAQVAGAIFASAELQQDIVQRDYQYFLHRAAEAGGLQNWSQALQHGMRDEQLAAALVGSPEYAQSVQGADRSLQQTLLPGNGPPPQDVLVVNTPSQPVPTAAQGTTAVTGNVGITGTPNVNVTNSPTVQAQQSGPWTVGISGTPTVNIGNSPTVQVASSASNPVFVRDVNNAVQPFHITLETAGVNTFLVPAGKRLVIEDVSGYAQVPTQQRGFFIVFTKIAGDVVFTSHIIPATYSFTYLGAVDYLIANEQVRIYADPNTLVVAQTSFNLGGAAFITISGYFVNVP
jgi:hypothetical protein